MNAVVALCHFCEMHGPSVMICTQPFQRNLATEIMESRNITEDGIEEGSGTNGLTKRSSLSETDSDVESDTFEIQDSFTSNTCSACRSFPKASNGFVTYGDDGDLWYLTLQYPHCQEVFRCLRQACVRSLSSEISPGREGPILFGDQHHGYVYCYTFYLKDNEARGLQRWYSIVVLSMDKLCLTQSWPFLTRCSRGLVQDLQMQAERTFNLDQAEKPQRATRLGGTAAINPENFRRQRRGKAMRSLPELTSNSAVFNLIHEQFTNLLHLGGNLMTEVLLEGSPSCCNPPPDQRFPNDDSGDGTCSITESQQYFGASEEDGIVLNHRPLSIARPDLDASLPRFEGIVHICRVLDKQAFFRMTHHIVIGNQIVVRGFHDFLVTSVIRALEILIPFGCRKSVMFSNNYEPTYNCNLLGLHADAPVPDDILSSPDCFVVDVLAAKMNEMNVQKYKIITPNHSLPTTRVPNYLTRVERILRDQDMVEEVAVALVGNLQERLMSKVKVLYKLFRTEHRSADELPVVMEKLHIPPEDYAVMKFWMSGLNSDYRGFLKELTPAVAAPLPSLKLHTETTIRPGNDKRPRESTEKNGFGAGRIQAATKENLVG